MRRAKVAMLTALITTLSTPATSASEVDSRSPAELSAAAREGLPQGAEAAHNDRTFATQWTALGPQPVASAINPLDSVAYVASGRVNAVAVDPRNGDVAYIAAAQGGVWKTIDAGATWTALTDSLPSLTSGAVALAPSHPDVVWYGTGEQNFCGDCLYGKGLFRSIDAGATWNAAAGADVAGSYIARILVSPFDENVVLVGSDRGVIRTEDGGLTWTTTLATGWCTDIAASPGSTDTVYAAINNIGVYRSTDGGVTWVKLAGGLPLSFFSRVNIAVAPSSASVVYASFVDIATGGLLGFYRSSDAGATWTQREHTPDYMTFKGQSTGQGWFDNCVAVDPADADICVVGGAHPDPFQNAILRTTDGGLTWAGIAIASDGARVHNDHHALVYGPDGRLWNANDGGVWWTLDAGLHWTNCNTSLAVTQFYTVATHPTDPDLLVGGTQDLGTLARENGEWTERKSYDGGPCSIDDAPALSFYATTRQFRDVCHIDEAGMLDITGPWSALGERADWANGAFLRSAEDPNQLFLGTYRLWSTSDAGLTWDPISEDLTHTSYGTLRSMARSPAPPHAVYVGTSDGYLWVKTDSDAEWNLRTNGLPLIPITGIAVDAGDWQTAYLTQVVTSGDRVFVTHDAGMSWTSATGDLVSGVRPISMVADFAHDPPIISIGTDYGVYVSLDGGERWAKAVGGLPNVAVYALALDSTRARIVAATHGRGMWTSPLPLSTGVTPRPPVTDPTDQPPVISVLSTHGRFTIGVRLFESARVVFDLHDVTGRRVLRTDMGSYEPGPHQIAWSPDVPSGLYILRATVGARAVTSRAVITR